MDRRARLVFLVLGLVIGAIAGAGSTIVAHLTSDDGSGRLNRPNETGAAPTATHPSSPKADVLATPASEREVAHHDDVAAAPQLLFGPVQRAHGEEGLRTGWARERHDEMPGDDLATGMARYEALVRDAPESIGLELAKARTKSEQALADSKAGGVFALLEAMGKSGVAPPVDAVRNRARFDAFFPRQTVEGFVDGATNRKHPDKALENGSTLSFPAGVFRVEGLMKDKDPFPDDVTVHGAGMDSTLLVMSGALFTRGALNRFTIQDCTLFTNNNYLFDLRAQPASMTLLRTRFIGFDMGAGGSVLLSANHGLALRAEDCRIEGGYGSTPWSGSLLDVRTDALLARFERCQLTELSLNMPWWRPGAAVLFLGCTFQDMLDRTDVTSRAATNPGVVFDGCSFAYLTGEAHENPPKKDLNALFPDWQARMNQ